MVGVALAGVEDGLGEVVQVDPRRIADIFHGDLDRELSPGRPRATPVLAEELVDQRLVDPRLGGEAVDHHLDAAAGELTGPHLAAADPALVAQSGSTFTAEP